MEKKCCVYVATIKYLEAVESSADYYETETRVFFDKGKAQDWFQDKKKEWAESWSDPESALNEYWIQHLEEHCSDVESFKCKRESFQR